VYFGVGEKFFRDLPNCYISMMRKGLICELCNEIFGGKISLQCIMRVLMNVRGEWRNIYYLNKNIFQHPRNENFFRRGTMLSEIFTGDRSREK
jgi:hypothetical protein